MPRLATERQATHSAMRKSVRTSFSPSPIHLEVREDAEIEKNVAADECAVAFPIRVFPVPGGPKRSIPLIGAVSVPTRKMSGRSIGQITASYMHAFANTRPAISSNWTFAPARSGKKEKGTSRDGQEREGRRGSDRPPGPYGDPAREPIAGREEGEPPRYNGHRIVGRTAVDDFVFNHLNQLRVKPLQLRRELFLFLLLVVARRATAPTAAAAFAAVALAGDKSRMIIHCQRQ